MLAPGGTPTGSPQGVRGTGAVLLVGTLHPGAVVAPLLIRAVVVGLSPPAPRGALARVVVLQVHLLRLAADHRLLGPRGQQVLQLLRRTHCRQLKSEPELPLTLLNLY